jgi:hypothetical protein
MSSCIIVTAPRQRQAGRPLPPGLEALQAHFLAILPRIERHARCYFRDRGADRREDAVAETVALAWRWFVRLAERGKDARRFPSVLAMFAARAVRGGRRVCGMEAGKDVLSGLAQQRHGFRVEKLPDLSTLSANPLKEALADNTQSPVPEQVAFRLDFPAWMRTRTERDRRIIDDMMTGERTFTLADRFGISPARVSQLRREFCEDWRRFTGEAQ